jgi:hypothetical protein
MSRQKLNYTSHHRVRGSVKEDDDSDPDDQTDEDIIRCVCDDSSDDGFTIQCENCEDWQHASCVNIKKSKIPKHYICDRCTRKLKRPPSESRHRDSLETDTKKGNRKYRRKPCNLKLNHRIDKKVRPIKNVKKRVYLQDSVENDEAVPKKISRKKFTLLSRSVFREKLVEDLLIEVHRQWMESNKPTGKNKLKIETSSTMATTSGAAAKRLESIVVMESNLLLPAIPKASVRPLRKYLRGSFLVQNQKDPSDGKGVFADIHIPKHRYLMEVTGELVKKSDYKNEASNHFSELGAPLAHVFFYRALDICIDARYAGNEARYIRRSCNPNSEIKSIILPNDNDDQTIHMGIYTSEEVDRGEEITIGWNWHKGFLMWHKSKEFVRNDHTVNIEPSEKKQLRKILKLITSEFGECACEDKDECLIEYLKDELKNEDDEQDVNSKKKRPSKKIVTKKPISRTIFSSDEEQVTKITEKPRKLKQLQEKKKIPSVVPASPAISLTDSVDIDIVSMSPIPSRPPSEPDAQEEPQVVVGLKRPRPLSPNQLPSNQLPCKKRWLRTFLAEQQLQKQPTLSTSPSIPNSSISVSSVTPSKPTQDPDPIYDESELSDGASSASTLPLEDTPTVIQSNTKQSMDTLLEQEEMPASEAASAVPATNQEQDSTQIAENSILPNHLNQKDISIAETPVTDKFTTASTATTIQKVTEAPRKKLTVREYLSIHRGNLPTPDERS